MSVVAETAVDLDGVLLNQHTLANWLLLEQILYAEPLTGH